MNAIWEAFELSKAQQFANKAVGFDGSKLLFVAGQPLDPNYIEVHPLSQSILPYLLTHQLQGNGKGFEDRLFRKSCKSQPSRQAHFLPDLNMLNRC